MNYEMYSRESSIESLFYEKVAQVSWFSIC